MNTPSDQRISAPEPLVPASEFAQMLDLVDAFVADFTYERSEENEHFVALVRRELQLARGVLTLISASDSISAVIVLRSQLEVFARLVSFFTNRKVTLRSEIEHQLYQLGLIQAHHDKFPNASFSINVSKFTDAIKIKWPGIQPKQSGPRSIFLSDNPPTLRGISAYGLYQTLCEESHAGFSSLAYRHRRTDVNADSTSTLARSPEHEHHSLLAMSSWMIFELCNIALLSDAPPESQGFVRRVGELYNAIQPTA